MREVSFKYWDQERRTHIPASGFFHTWGSEIMEGNDGSANSGTVGIVEDMDGQVHKVNPEHIQFTYPSLIKLACPNV